MVNATGKSLRTQTPQQVGVLELRLYMVWAQEWRSWRAPREQRWDNVESRSRGTVLGAGVGRADAKHRTGKQSGEYGAGGSGTSRRPGAAPTAAAVIAASARHLSKEARASLHID